MSIRLFDDMVLKIKSADCKAFASPLNFWTILSKIKAFVEKNYCIVEEDPKLPIGKYERYPVRDGFC